MLAYDQYAHRMNMENQQRMILQRQQQMMWQNEQIIANQAAARREMSYDTAMVMLSQFLR